MTMVCAWLALKQNNFKTFKRQLGLTILLATVFVIIKGYEYYSKFSHDMFPQTNTFLSIHFTLTGLHALHMLGGISIMAYFWGPGNTMWKSDPKRFTNRIEIIGLYWQFVDLIWIFIP